MPQPLLRNTHKSRIQALLTGLTVGGVTMDVSVGYTNSGLKYPFVFITSGAISPNERGASSIADTNMYDRRYEYYITLAFRMSKDGNIDPAQEARVDEAEEKILNVLQSAPVRVDTNWFDLVVTQVSPTFTENLLMGTIEDNLLLKVFTLEVRALVTKAILP